MNIALAESLARKVHGTYVRSLPVDVADIAEQLGIHVKEFPLGFHPEFAGSSGVAFIENGQRHILVNSSDPAVRKRFTLAHELAHHVIGHTEGGHRFRDNMKPQDIAYQYDELEVEANRFAAELLMPADLVIAAFKNDHAKSVREIADLFGVSEAAMNYRMKHLRLIR